jgi:pimeloyl-ACP methyl ester carboxylesterase
MPPLSSPEPLELGGLRTAVRRSAGPGTPTLFVHGNPSFSFDWLPFAERLAGPAITIDLPGFGDAERPAPERFDCTMGAYADWIGTAIDELGLDRFKLVVHDWGGIALQPASERADRVERLVVINAVPLLAGYRWHWVARRWRTPRVGEFLNRTTTKASFRMLLRFARPGFRAMPDEWLEQTWSHFDAGTRDAVLALYRSADPRPLIEAGAKLGELSCPSLVVWGGKDPYIGSDWGRAYARALPGSELEEEPAAGHWPWIDRPELVDRVAAFLDGTGESPVAAGGPSG